MIDHMTGIAHHDGWRPYRAYDVIHSLCNAHHLRELDEIGWISHQFWADDMAALLCDAKDMVETAKAARVPLPLGQHSALDPHPLRPGHRRRSPHQSRASVAQAPRLREEGLQPSRPPRHPMGRRQHDPAAHRQALCTIFGRRPHRSRRSRHDIAVRRPRHHTVNGRVISSLHQHHRAIEIEEVPGAHRRRGSRRSRRAPHSRQLRHPQDTGHQTVASTPPPIPPALHAHRFELAQPRRALVLRTDHQEDQARCSPSAAQLQRDIKGWIKTWNEQSPALRLGRKRRTRS